MHIDVDWTSFKNFADARLLNIQYLDLFANYYLSANDGSFTLNCLIPQNGGSDQTDFETNYKTRHSTNVSPVQALTPTTFTSKMVNSHGVQYNLFPRNTGFSANVVNGVNTITYTATYPWVKFIGLEVINAAVGETASMLVLDSTTGTYTGVNNAPLAQFGYTLNIAPTFYARQAPFDADLFVGMQLRISFNSVTVLGKTIYINLIMNEVKVPSVVAITNPVTGFSY